MVTYNILVSLEEIVDSLMSKLSWVCASAHPLAPSLLYLGNVKESPSLAGSNYRCSSML